MTTSQLPNPEMVEQALRDLVSADVVCRPAGDHLILDTPYILQDGSVLRTFLDVDEGGLLKMSDGGLTMRELEKFARSNVALRDRSNAVAAIAKSLRLLWEDGELVYKASDIHEAMRRLAILAQAADRSLSLLEARPLRKPVPLRQKLAADLRAAGLMVSQKVRVTRRDQPKVVVDHLVRRNGSQAAIEVLTGRTRGGANISVDRAITNFHILHAIHYAGRLIAVYDETSPAAEPELRERFSEAKPDSALLVPGSEAAPRIQASLS
jgi:hypothetical protein